MFPVLDRSEIERVRHFGTLRSYRKGDVLAKAGSVTEGFTIILSGKVDVTQHAPSGPGPLIVAHGPGSFMGELAQLAGQPALVDARAQEDVEALIIPRDQLRALLIAEAELGERIMRALILRRVGLLETGSGGPLIIGRADDGDVLRLTNFLRRNSQPQLMLDPETDAEAKALIERFHVDPNQLPIVLCPSGQMLRNPGENELAAVSAWWGRSTRTASMTLLSLEQVLPVSLLRSTPVRKGCRRWCSIAARLAAKPGLRPGLRIISAFLPASAASL